MAYKEVLARISKSYPSDMQISGNPIGFLQSCSRLKLTELYPEEGVCRSHIRLAIKKLFLFCFVLFSYRGALYTLK